ncbi:secretion/conjugation apparatus DotM-related subunit [Parachitinimonas caeni]|uniref:DotM C-terminal cytoplasmic domain-containing protein n=1 Tax=Parachitinimonas caeni TaxID=3031301 RepID=A0ABT7DUY2_9NEIS|nr:hypothetical protein [Parachitinimonas caeni]MDK2123862.1 hypothetical protein [Parachitinimonas caeni]
MAKQDSAPTLSGPAILVLAAATLYGACWLAWVTLHGPLARSYLWLRLLELATVFLPVFLLSRFVDIAPFSWIGSWIDRASQADYASYPWADIARSSLFFNIFWLAVLCGLCWRWAMQHLAHHPKMRFARRHTLDSYARLWSQHFAHLPLFRRLRLIEQPLDHPVYGMALNLKGFLLRHGLVSAWSGEGRPLLDETAARAVFARQLGGLWRGTKGLTDTELLVFAALAPRVAATDSRLDDSAFKAALALSDRLLKSYWGPVSAADCDVREPEFDLEAAQQAIEQYGAHSKVQAVIDQHAFNRSILWAMLLEARRVGILPACEFRWLRFCDRPLWYLVNNVGRTVTFPEAAGPMSHFLHERMTGPSASPRLDNALAALKSATERFDFNAEDREAHAAKARKREHP